MYPKPVKNAIFVCLHVTTEAGPPLTFPQCHLYGLYKAFSNMNVPGEVKGLALLLGHTPHLLTAPSHAWPFCRFCGCRGAALGGGWVKAVIRCLGEIWRSVFGNRSGGRAGP